MAHVCPALSFYWFHGAAQDVKTVKTLHFPAEPTLDELWSRSREKSGCWDGSLSHTIYFKVLQKPKELNIWNNVGDSLLSFFGGIHFPIYWNVSIIPARQQWMRTQVFNFLTFHLGNLFTQFVDDWLLMFWFWTCWFFTAIPWYWIRSCIESATLGSLWNTAGKKRERFRPPPCNGNMATENSWNRHVKEILSAVFPAKTRTNRHRMSRAETCWTLHLLYPFDSSFSLDHGTSKLYTVRRYVVL